MPATYHNLRYHIVFATKHRLPMITPDLKDRLYSYVGSIVNDEGGFMIDIGGMPDHVHILAGLKPSVSVSHLLKQVKGSSSSWVNRLPGRTDKFGWQVGYSAFSVSESRVAAVRRYIKTRKSTTARSATAKSSSGSSQTTASSSTRPTSTIDAARAASSSRRDGGEIASDFNHWREAGASGWYRPSASRSPGGDDTQVGRILSEEGPLARPSGRHGGLPLRRTPQRPIRSRMGRPCGFLPGESRGSMT